MLGHGHVAREKIHGAKAHLPARCFGFVVHLDDEVRDLLQDLQTLGFDGWADHGRHFFLSVSSNARVAKSEREQSSSTQQCLMRLTMLAGR